MAEIRSVCVYCGSSAGDDPAFAEAATAMGRLLAREGIRLVYGGGRIGLMGTVADAALAAGGRVHGVIPRALAIKEVAHAGLTELEVVPDMHARKARMAELADGFVTMPGGLGTLEEFFETLTWAQLGWHRKPIALLNVRGYYDGLVSFVSKAADDGFVGRNHVAMFSVHPGPERALRALREHVPVETRRYVGRDDL